MTTLYLAEKPSVAKDLARVLGAQTRHEGYLEGPDVLVTWALGHLVRLADPDGQNDEWAGPWRAATLPMVPDRWAYTLTENGKAQFKVVKGLLTDKRVTTVVAATDAGREGERIFRLIYAHAGSHKPVKRLWVSSLTDEALRAGLDSLKDGAGFDGLAHAAEARGRADWLVGMNLSRAYSLRNDQKCTIGRVQTPTLALVVRRQLAIKGFVSKDYYQISAELAPGFAATYLTPDGKDRLDTKTAADPVFAEVQIVRDAVVRSLDSKQLVENPPALFDLLNLQRETNKRFGWPAAKTLEVAQALYEEHKVLTYPRTESRHLSTDIVPTLPKVIDALSGPYGELATLAKARQEPLGKAYVDDTKLTDHHAIIPTNRPAPAGSLGPDEAKLYDLVARRFLAIYLPPRLTDRTEARLTIGQHAFRAVGLVETQQGWTVALPPSSSPDPDDDSEADGPDGAGGKQKLPALAVGQSVQKLGQKLVAKKTQPPKPFNDASLLAAMKAASSEIDDEELAEHMKQSGLGTAATRAETIEKLIRTEYIERKKKALLATAKGEALIAQVSPELADPKLTAEWERRLAAIEDGTDSAAAFEAAIATYVRKLVPEVLAMSDSEVMPASANPDVLGTCPACNKGQVRAAGPKGWGCSRYKEEPACRFMLWRELAGKNLTETIVKELLTNGETKKAIEGFKSTKSEGKTFSAKLKLGPDHKIVFAFEDKPTVAPGEPLGTCLACGKGQVVATPKGWGCTDWKAGCKFTIWRTNYGLDLTEAIARELLTNRTTSEKLDGFKSKDGTPFSARLIIDDAFKVVAARE